MVSAIRRGISGACTHGIYDQNHTQVMARAKTKANRKSEVKKTLLPEWRKTMGVTLPKFQSGMNYSVLAKMRPSDLEGITVADIARVASTLPQDTPNPTLAALKLLCESAETLRLTINDVENLQAHLSDREKNAAILVERMGFDPWKIPLPMTHPKFLAELRRTDHLGPLKIDGKLLSDVDIWVAFLQSHLERAAEIQGRKLSAKESAKLAKTTNEERHKTGWEEGDRKTLWELCSEFIYWRDSVVRNNRNKFPKKNYKKLLT